MNENILKPLYQQNFCYFVNSAVTIRSTSVTWHACQCTSCLWLLIIALEPEAIMVCPICGQGQELCQYCAAVSVGLWRLSYYCYKLLSLTFLGRGGSPLFSCVCAWTRKCISSKKVFFSFLIFIYMWLKFLFVPFITSLLWSKVIRGLTGASSLASGWVSGCVFVLGCVSGCERAPGDLGSIRDTRHEGCQSSERLLFQPKKLFWNQEVLAKVTRNISQEGLRRNMH